MIKEFPRNVPHGIKASIVNGKYYVSTIKRESDLKVIDSMLSAFPAEGRADLSAEGDYETMVFHCDEIGNVSDWGELDFNRYATREEAVEGHDFMSTEWETR